MKRVDSCLTRRPLEICLRCMPLQACEVHMYTHLVDDKQTACQLLIGRCSNTGEPGHDYAPPVIPFTTQTHIPACNRHASATCLGKIVVRFEPALKQPACWRPLMSVFQQPVVGRSIPLQSFGHQHHIFFTVQCRTAK
jgi:hypothetical protein